MGGFELLNDEAEVSRRGVLRAGAWAVPVIAIAASAPVVSASIEPQCAPIVLDWAQLFNGSTYVRTSGMLGTATVDDITMTVSAAYGSAVAPNSNSLSLYKSGVNGGLWLSSANIDGAQSTGDFNTDFAQTVTLTFSEQIVNLRFGLTDFDYAASGAHGEQARVVTPLPDSTSQGSWVGGSNDGPYGFHSLYSGNIGSFNATGQVHFTFAGPLQSVTFQYVSPRSGGGIDILPLTFEKASC